MPIRRVLRKRAPEAQTVETPAAPPEPATVTQTASASVARPKLRKVGIAKKSTSTEQGDDADTTEAIDNKLSTAIYEMEMRARTYRLSIGSLGDYRSLRNHERVTVMKEDTASVRASKRLYDPADFHIKAILQAQDRLRDFFRAFTVAHPEPGSRMFVIKRTWDDATAVSSDIETAMAKQLDEFHKTMNENIQSYYDNEVTAAANNWDEVLTRAKAYTKDLFDPTQYPTVDALRDILYIRFYPVPSVLPPEYNRIDPGMRSQIADAIRQQMEGALAQQLLDIEDSLNSSLAGLQEKLEETGKAGSHVRFFDSRLTNVQKAIEMYQNSMNSLGLSLGTSLPNRLAELKLQLARAGDDPKRAIAQIKTSTQVRTEVLESVKAAISSTAAAFTPVRRRITVR